MSRHINAFQDNDFLEIGRLIHDESYRREKKEILFENTKFDLIKGHGNDIVVAEVKKSSHSMKAAEMQLAFYLWRLEKKGIKATGEIRIPKEKKRLTVSLTDELKTELENTVIHIEEILNHDKPDRPKKIKVCKNCSYNEFCWS